MPELRKIETSAAYTPSAGEVVEYLAEEDGKLVLKVKKSDGTEETLSGGSGVDVSGLTAVSDNVRSGFTFIGASGTVQEGTMPPAVPDIFTIGNGVFMRFNREGYISLPRDDQGDLIPHGYVGYIDFYKCAEVFGPQTVCFLDVTNAGTDDCNGRYNDTGELKNGETLYQYESSSGTTWYIYFVASEYDGDCWVLSNNLNSDNAYNSYYFSYQQTGTWESGEYGGGSATVTLGGELVNADQPKTWSGFKAAFDGEKFIFDAVATDGLPYDNLIPRIGGVYSKDCTVDVSYLYTGFPEISCPVDPTGDKFGDWVISASSVYDSPRSAYKAFTSSVTNQYSDGWHSKGEKPVWIQWRNTREKVLVKNYSVLFRSDTAAVSGEFLLQGSLDGINWQTIDTVDNSSGTVEVVRSISNETAYYYHRIYFTGDSEQGSQYLMVYKIMAKSK